MTPSENRPDAPSQRPLAGVLLAVLLLSAVAVSLVGNGGCSKQPKPLPNDKPPGSKDDPWKTAGQRLKKDPDWAGTKLALGGLVTDLNSQDKEKLPVISDAEFAKLAELVPLSPLDREDVRATSFSAHDSVYVADCLAMRDAARSLALGGFPPEQQAELAFAWVCRQVYLQPWLLDARRPESATALPPTAVLRRGFGSGLERMYVFLSLLQQLELDGCLIGPPDAGNQPAGLPIISADKKAYLTGAPRGPFWAVGVRVGNDVKLFDPWRGQPFPATLAQLKATPDASKAWFEDKLNASGATLEDAKKATAFLAVPVNSLSPRMGAVDAKLKGELGVKFSYDAKALRDSFPDPKPAYWNPADEPAQLGAFAYGHAARSLLPLDMGGADNGQPGGRVFDAYRRDQIPTGAFAVPDSLVPEPAKRRLGGTAASILGLSFIEPPNPRERIQRGQFQDAAKDLVVKQDMFASGLERLRLNKDADQEIKTWIDAANGLYEELGRTQLNNDKAGEARLLTEIENHWKAPGARFLIDRSSSEVGLAEATFLLALCKHELAERSQARVERVTGAEAERLRLDATDNWKTALSAWQTYQQLSAAHAGFPGRAAHGQVLAARAEKLANAPVKK